MKSSYSGTNGCVDVSVPTKSTFSVSGSCVEVGTPRKSNRSTTNGCVEHGRIGSMILVRDSKDKDGTGQVLQFTTEAWELRVLDPIKSGTFDWETFSPLEFTEEERDAFLLGVLDGEFDLVGRAE